MNTIEWDTEALREFAKFIAKKLDNHSFISIPKGEEFNKLLDEFAMKNPAFVICQP